MQQSNKKITLLGLFFMVVVFLTIGIVIIKAQEQQQPDDQELQLINKLIVEDLKIKGLVDEIGVDIMFHGSDGSKSYHGYKFQTRCSYK